MKNRSRFKLSNSLYRVLLSEVLPYELPISFTNGGFYQFVRRSQLSSYDGRQSYTMIDQGAGSRVLLKILMGQELTYNVSSQPAHESSNKQANRSIATISLLDDAGNPFRPSAKYKYTWTVPYNFGIRHKKSDLRTLSVMHPRAQLDMVDIYRHFSSSMVQYTRNSNYSIRYPSRIAKYTVSKDSLFKKLHVDGYEQFETYDDEYDRYHSYFRYKRYSTIHRFYDSKEYLECERKYGYLVKIDVSKCFDSIYTHTIAWATHGKQIAKQYLRNTSDSVFPSVFDSLMQSQNHGETNGILIGPELSRIFSEIILQSVDQNIERQLLTDGFSHRRDYEILRYVDDYFIFLPDASKEEHFVSVVREKLKVVKLNLNAEKYQAESTPLQSLRSIAKRRIENSINSAFDTTALPQYFDTGRDSENLGFGVESILRFRSTELILNYKAILFDTDVDHGDLANYTMSIVESKVELIFEIVAPYLLDQSFPHNENLTTDLVRILCEILDFTFFIYSGCPKVGISIRLARIVATSLEFLKNSLFREDTIDQVRHKVANEIDFQVRRQTGRSRSMVENLYLLQISHSLGSHYSLSADSLSHCFRITKVSKVGSSNSRYLLPQTLDAFSVVGLLAYMRDYSKFAELRNSLQVFIRQMYVSSKMTHNRLNDAERAILSLDLLSCPFVGRDIKREILTYYGESDRVEQEGAMKMSKYWFTDWDIDRNYYASLLLKRRQPVY